MNADTFLRDLVTQLEPNAAVVSIDEVYQKLRNEVAAAQRLRAAHG